MEPNRTRRPRAPLPGSLRADVCIVGAGYTGLWTAYYLKKAAPQLRVVILEQRFAGYGASGRNGGWLTNAVTGGRGQYVKTHGREAAALFQTHMNETVDEVIRVATLEGIDADIVKGGEFTVAYDAPQQSRLIAEVRSEQSWSMTDVELLSAKEATDRINVVGTTGASWHPHCARIQPAKLASGLASVVEALGVEIYEDTRVSEILPHRAVTERGTVEADFVVRATEGFTAGLKNLHRAWLPMNSSLIATEPLSASMTSKTVAMMLIDLGITRTHSRPRVSNDNPFSEAQFKTLKYVPDFPHHFNSLAEAQAFCEGFFIEYNHHSGIGWHTPASVHFGTHHAIDQQRTITLNRAFNEHPERFARRPRPPQIRTEVWINEPVKETPQTIDANVETV